MPKHYILNIAVFLMLISINSLAINNYLTKKLPIIMQQLQNNTDDLIAQRRTIDITKKALDALAKRQGISQNKADIKKQELESIFANNLKQSSSFQRALYNIKRPFYIAYNKIIDPNATYLERFAYAAAATVGVVITGYTIYRGGKYAYSAIPAWQIKKPSIITPEIPSELTNNIKLPSKQTIEQRLINNNVNPEIAHNISETLGDNIKNPLGVINTVVLALERYASNVRPDRQYEILWQDTEIVYNILEDNPQIAEKAARYLAKTTRQSNKTEY